MSSDQRYKLSGSFLEIMNVFYNQINSYEEKDLIFIAESFLISDAIGNDIDSIGELVGVPRNSNESGEDYRSRILSYISGYDKRPTKEGLEFISQQVVGITPTVFEYPAMDFSGIFGKTHPGIILSFTINEINTLSAEIGAFRRYAKNYKAAGVPMLVGTLFPLVEQYLLLIDDLFLPNMKWNFNEFTNILFPEAYWDTTNWDQSTFEKDEYFLDEPFLIKPESRFIENYLETISDVIGFIITKLLTEIWTAGIVDTTNIGIGYREALFGGWDELEWDYSKWDDSHYELIDTFVIKDITLPFSETILAVDIEAQFLGDVFAKFIVNYIAGFVDSDFSLDGTLKEAETLSTPTDTLLNSGEIRITDSPYTGSSAETKNYRKPAQWDSLYTCNALKVGSGTIGSSGGKVAGDSDGSGWDEAWWDGGECEHKQYMELDYT